MIDTFAILLTTGLTFLILLRAVRRDRVEPWFPAEKEPPDAATSWRRRTTPATRPRGG